MAVSMKNLQQEGKTQLKLENSIKQTFLCLLQKVILRPGVVRDKEFATEIQETKAQVLCTIKTLLSTFMCEIPVMHRTCAGHPINVEGYNTATALIWYPIALTTREKKINRCTNITYTFKFFQTKCCFCDSLQTENFHSFIICTVLELAPQTNYLTKADVL